MTQPSTKIVPNYNQNYFKLFLLWNLTHIKKKKKMNNIIVSKIK